AQEREDLLPAVERLLDPVHRPVIVEEPVPGAVVAVKLVGLAVLIELGLVLVHLLGGRRAILVAEQAEERAGEFRCEVDRRRRLLRIELLLAHDDAAAPELDGGVDALGMAGEEEGLAAARARAEDADLAVEPGLR